MSETTSEARGPFTAAETAFLRSQQLGRLATLTADGDPVVVPLVFELTVSGVINVRGFSLERSAKWRNLSGDPRFALVVDSGIGSTARGVMVRGVGAAQGVGNDAVLVLEPRRIVSWGLDTKPFDRQGRDV